MLNRTVPLSRHGQERCMTNRPSHPRRRLTAWVGATLLGVAGAVAGGSPASAVGTCTMTFQTTYWPTIEGTPRWYVQPTLTNTNTAQAATWLAALYFPYSSGAKVTKYWNTKKREASGRAWGA